MGNTLNAPVEEVAQKGDDHKQRQATLDAEIEKLKNYVVGDMSEPEQFDNNGLDRTTITKIRIGLIGPTGSGKSSFINTCERTLKKKGRGTCDIQSSGNEGTTILRDYLPTFKFRLVDTRGFFHFESIQPFIEIMEGLLMEGETICNDNAQLQTTAIARKKPPISEQVNAVIFFVSGDDPRLLSKLYVGSFSKHREYLRANGIPVITIVTRSDKVEWEGRSQVLADASAATASPTNKTFFLTNYTVDDCPRDIDIEETIVKVLQYALTAAENTIRMKMTKERRTPSVEAPTIAVTVIFTGTAIIGRLETGQFTVPASYTFSGLMHDVKHTYQIPDTSRLFFSDYEGNVLPPDTCIQDVLQENGEVYLMKTNA